MTLNLNFMAKHVENSDNIPNSWKTITINVTKVLEEEHITQLCIAFATISDQVGGLDSKRLKGGMPFLVSGWLLDRDGTDDLLCIYLSSNLDI